MRVFIVIWVAALLVLPVGCATHTRPLTAEREKGLEERNFDAVWEASLEVLRKYHFRTDRRDRRARVITTLPMTGKQFFEFWRRDAATAGDLTESSIQTIYRSAVIKILHVTGAPGGPSFPPGTFEPSVRVAVFRSDLPQPQITSTSEAYDMFVIGGGGRSKYLLESGRIGEHEGIVDLGRDRNLEAKIEAEIRSAAAVARAPAYPCLPPAGRQVRLAGRSRP